MVNESEPVHSKAYVACIFVQENDGLTFIRILWLEHKPSLKLRIVLGLYPNFFVTHATFARKLVPWRVVLNKLNWLSWYVKHAFLIHVDRKQEIDEHEDAENCDFRQKLQPGCRRIDLDKLFLCQSFRIFNRRLCLNFPLNRCLLSTEYFCQKVG